MTIKKKFKNNFGFSKEELAVFKKLNSPWKIQCFIDKLSYNKNDNDCFSPRLVLKKRKANCLDAAIFAAAALRLHGFKPLLVDLRAVRDEDHILALFKVNNCFGSIAKSKFLGLRYRDPVYKSIRELAMSYFQNYFNYGGEKTLRAYSVQLDLSVFDKKNWMASEKPLWFIGNYIDKIKHEKILSKSSEKQLSKVEQLRFKREISILPKDKKSRQKIKAFALKTD